MSIENEYRKVCYLKNYDAATNLFHQIIGSNPYREYAVHFVGSYRMKEGVVELKTVIRRKAFYFDGVWLQYITSKETPQKEWTLYQHRRYIYFVSHRRIVTEHRLEAQLSSSAKFFAFHRPEERKCGLVFELEADAMSEVYAVYYKSLAVDMVIQSPSPDYLHRRQVFHGECDATVPHFRAIKYDGVFGYVLCHQDFLWERWEDNVSRIVNATFYPGLVFAAERLDGGVVILLDVLSVGKCGTFRKDVRHILRDFFNDLRQQDLPPGYAVQCYLDPSVPIPATDYPTDGIIFHSFDDRVFKKKSVHTIELYYEKGQLHSSLMSYNCNATNLKEGSVYECSLIQPGLVAVHKERKDRCLCNNESQLKDALG